MKGQVASETLKLQRAVEQLAAARDVANYDYQLSQSDLETVSARVQAGTVTDGTSSFTRRDGERVELEWTTIPTRVAGLPYWVSIVRRAGR